MSDSHGSPVDEGGEFPQASSENAGPADVGGGRLVDFLAGSRERKVETTGADDAEEVSEQMIGRIDRLIDLTRVALGISTEKP